MMISSQMGEVDLILNQLFEAINAFKPPDHPEDQANRGNRLMSSINMKIRTVKLWIQTNIRVISGQEIDVKAKNALPKVEVCLKMLQDVLDIINKDLDRKDLQ